MKTKMVAAAILITLGFIVAGCSNQLGKCDWCGKLTVVRPKSVLFIRIYLCYECEPHD